MKNNLLPYYYATIIFIVALSLVYGCRKTDYQSSEPTNHIPTEIKKWLAAQKTDSVTAITINKIINRAEWKNAQVINADSNKLYRVVPLITNTSSQDNSSNSPNQLLVIVQINNHASEGYILEYLNISNSPLNVYSLVVGFGKLSVGNSFSGNISKLSLYERFREYAEYENGRLTKFTILKRKTKNDGVPDNHDKSVNGFKKETDEECIDWYLETYVDNVLVDSQYLGRTCTGGPGCVYPTSVRNNNGTLSFGKRILNDCGGGGGNDGSEEVNADTTVSDSLKANAKAYCIYQLLKNNSVFTSLIAGFTNNSSYNLKFDVGNLGAGLNGTTKFDIDFQNHDVSIILDREQIDNRFAFDIARTYIHEAYHAYITRILIENNGPWGLFTQADFNKPLEEILDAYLRYSIENKRIQANSSGQTFDHNAAQHQVIAENIDRIATGVKEYVELRYPNITNATDITMDNYRAVAWVGLDKTQAFKDKWGTTQNATWKSLQTALTYYTTLDCK